MYKRRVHRALSPRRPKWPVMGEVDNSDSKLMMDVIFCKMGYYRQFPNNWKV